MQTEYKNCSYKVLRKFNYEYQINDVQNTYGIDITSFTKNPYTYIKCRYFVELSTLIVFFLRRTNISPNIMSLLTAFSAIIGGILILFPYPYLITFGLFFFFNGYVFDWCDGLLARVMGRASLTGKMLDDWSTHSFVIAFKLFIGLYVASYTSDLFFYIVPLIVFFSAINIKTYFQSLMFEDLIKKNLKIKRINQSNIQNHEVDIDSAKDFFSKNLKLTHFLSSFLDDRSRTIDLTCLLILIEQFLSVHIVWLVFIFMIMKEFFRFLINMFFVIMSGWCESKVEPNP